MKALKDAGLTKDEIDDVVMVGGQTRTPKVLETVRKVFGREPNRSVNPDEVVSMGAAIQTGITSGEVTDLVLLDITPHTFGIETKDGTFTPLIDRQATVPTKKSRIFTTDADNQTTFEVHVLQGENEQAAYNTSLGRFSLAHIAPAPKGNPKIEVSFEIDINGILYVTALDLATGHEENFVPRATGGLTMSEVDRLRDEFRSRAEEWQKETERQRGKEQLLVLIANTKKKLSAVSGKLTEDERARAQEALEAAEQATSGDNREVSADPSRLQALAERLSQVSNAVVARVIEEAKAHGWQIQVTCPACDTQLKVSPKATDPGKRIRCPSCRNVFDF